MNTSNSYQPVGTVKIVLTNITNSKDISILSDSSIRPHTDLLTLTILNSTITPTTTLSVTTNTTPSVTINTTLPVTINTTSPVNTI
uniref:Uncharacterized protein n=1 Tax=Acrobeloides nanus TaxID=290746 RepID=A0A914EJ65_9BILA